MKHMPVLTIFGQFWSSTRSTSEKSQNYTEISFQWITDL